MNTASALSAKIRAKKKAMADGAVKLSGIPEDATDIETIKMQEPGERLSENEMPPHDEDPSLDSLVAADASGGEHIDTTVRANEMNDEASAGNAKRKMKIRTMMGKMRK